MNVEGQDGVGDNSNAFSLDSTKTLDSDKKIFSLWQIFFYYPRAIFGLFGIIAFYFYSHKFLTYSVDYVSTMSRDISFGGVQQNIAYYSNESLILFVGGFLLISYILIQNEFNNLFAEPRKFPALSSSISLLFDLLQNMYLWITLFGFLAIVNEGSYSVLSIFTALLKGSSFGLFCGLLIGFILRGYHSSFFAMIMFLVSYFIVPLLSLSTTGISFFLIGGAVLTSFLLIQNNIGDLFKFKSIKSLGRGEIISLSSILFFVILVFQISFIPVLSQNLIEILSLILAVNVAFWIYILGLEKSKPSIQEHRTASIVFMVALPILLYFLLRFLYLLNHPDTVMRNRWELAYDFMSQGNTFKVNTWPLEVFTGSDSRWLFYKAAIINSARVTLVSIFLCTILGIIVGVTRLSSNKLASSLATAYVEIFRNLPLAVLLFLIATQMGHQFPLFSEEKSIMGLIYYSNQGIWFVTVAEHSRIFFGLIFLGLVKIIMRQMARVEPRKVNDSKNTFLQRPFSLLGWRNEALASDLLVLLAVVFFAAMSYPFFTTASGGLECIIGSIFLIYSLLVFTNVDDSGINEMVMDDSAEGLRKSFTIWTLSISVAIGVAISAGFSHPELLKPSTSPGSWRFIADHGFEITPAFSAMILGLTLFTASVVAEIVRGSIQALPRGQVEAAISLGLNPFQRLRLVILPQALRSMIPLLNNQFMNVWKNSSLAIIVAYNDIFYQFLVMANNVGKLIPLFLLLLVTYQLGSLMISAIMNWFNARVTSVKI
ncbi:MAG: ABC transporter permease subunit [Euryarchaeota archaeon]|nr:ABC transporter permease subunit [Euryarchaeota archaeon]MBT7414026.1 ABC transporter permease subunit [Euryarchaeota archaeon]